MSQALAMSGAQREATPVRFYRLAAIALLLITLWGFSATYFAPLFRSTSAFGGRVADLPLIVHVHGWSFFLWYALLVVQVSLIRGRSLILHRRIGIASVMLAGVMVITGFVTITFNIHLTLEHQGPPVWRLYGLAILMTLVLFALYYALAIGRRSDPQAHKRLMLMAGVPAIGSALFRIFLAFGGAHPWNIPVSMLLPALVVVAGMVHDRRAYGRVHGVYWVSLPLFLVVQAIAMLVPHATFGPAVLEAFSAIGANLAVFYGRGT